MEQKMTELTRPRAPMWGIAVLVYECILLYGVSWLLLGQTLPLWLRGGGLVVWTTAAVLVACLLALGVIGAYWMATEEGLTKIERPFAAAAGAALGLALGIAVVCGIAALALGVRVLAWTWGAAWAAGGDISKDEYGPGLSRGPVAVLFGVIVGLVLGSLVAFVLGCVALLPFYLLMEDAGVSSANNDGVGRDDGAGRDKRTGISQCPHCGTTLYGMTVSRCYKCKKHV